MLDLAPRMQVDRYKIHDIEVVVDRLQVTDDMNSGWAKAFREDFAMGKTLFLLINDDNKLAQYSKQLMCEDTGISYEEPSPEHSPFNTLWRSVT